MNAAPKKRGRKPKGGKIVDKPPEMSVAEPQVQNVILHLRCSLKEVDPTLFSPTVVEPYREPTMHMEVAPANMNSEVLTLAKMLHDNTITSQSDCFWCTCPYDTQCVYIPKFKLNDAFVVYGSFCCPECAAAFLMNDVSLDQSTRMERYTLLSHVYSPGRYITPAVSPHYVLNKYFGSLTIDDYRKLNKATVFTTVVEKPISVSFPEMMQCPVDPPVSQVKVQDQTYRLCRKRP